MGCMDKYFKYSNKTTGIHLQAYTCVCVHVRVYVPVHGIIYIYMQLYRIDKCISHLLYIKVVMIKGSILKVYANIYVNTIMNYNNNHDLQFPKTSIKFNRICS